jgi:hypothetical protein
MRIVDKLGVLVIWLILFRAHWGAPIKGAGNDRSIQVYGVNSGKLEQEMRKGEGEEISLRDEGLAGRKREIWKTVRRRRWRLRLGPLALYVQDEFEDLLQEPRKTEDDRKRLPTIVKALPLGAVLWVTDVVDIFVHVSSAVQ